MKKFLLMVSFVAMMALASCNGGSDYKAKGEEMSKQLDEQVEKNDTAAVLESDEAIRKVEADLVAKGDTAALADFREAMKDSRVRNAAFVTVAKVRNGMEREKAFEELKADALNQNISIGAVTTAINALLDADGKAE